ncbi:MAG TPA: hypothetical protein VF660_06395, partial [Actinomycetota bacterium]
MNNEESTTVSRQAWTRWAAVALVAVAALLFASRTARFASDLRTLPATRDTRWYVWRSKFLTVEPPKQLVAWRGPTGTGGGGYRVGSPLLGSLLLRLTGIQGYTLSTFFVAGAAPLLALALAGLAFTYRRSLLLFLSVALLSGALFFANAFVGYTDNLLALLIVVTGLSLIGRRNEKAVFASLFVFAAFFAHPPAATVFAVAVIGGCAIGALKRLGGPGFRSEAPVAASAALGAIAAISFWYLGGWGFPARFGDAIDVANVPREQFVARLIRWTAQLTPWLTVPLIVAGIVFIVLNRRRDPTDRIGTVMILWALPVLGALGVLTGLVYPYPRFLNVTVGHVLLAGLGLWGLTHVGRRALRRGRSSNQFWAIAGVVLIVLVAAPLWVAGSRDW